MTLGIWSRVARQKAQGRAAEAGGSGRLSRWAGDPRLEEKGDNREQNSGVCQSKGGGWGGSKDIEGERKLNIQKIVDKYGAGFSLDVTLVTEPNFGSVPDRGCNTTTS